MSEKIYVVVTLRHESLYGKNWALFWAKDENGYTSDPYQAHRYKESEIGPFGSRINDSVDIPVPIEALGLALEYRAQRTDGVIRLIEKGYINAKYRPIYFHDEN